MQWDDIQKEMDGSDWEFWSVSAAAPGLAGMPPGAVPGLIGEPLDGKHTHLGFYLHTQKLEVTCFKRTEPRFQYDENLFKTFLNVTVLD